MIYNTQTFWSYICNESQFIINQVKELLTRKDYDFDTKTYNIRKFYQNINKIEMGDFIYESIRFPTGLIPFITKKLPLQIEKIDRGFKNYTEQEVLDYANIVKEINPKFEIRGYQIEACLASLNNFQSLIHSSVGSGKEQPCDIIIPTPEGFKKFGALKPGDAVFGKNGKSQKVIGIYPQGMKDVYRISFQNGASVECGLEHLWTVRRNRGKNKTITLKDIKDSYYKIDKRGFKRYLYSVDYIEPVEYQQKSYFIDPYLLGILIGDGTLTTENIGFSCPNAEIEIVQKISDLLPKTYHLQPNLYPTCPQYYIRMSTPHGKGKFNLYKKEIERLKLNVKSHLKFIPEEYLLGSIQQRKELLAGLLDADGCCRKRTKSCSITYGTTSERLAKDVQQLVFSLGGAATIRSYKRKNRNREYEVCIELLFNPFYLTRKRNNYIPYLINNTIVNIEKIRKAECMCIKVSNEDELYITQNYIPTHNTSVMSLICKILESDRILILNGNNIILQQIYERLFSFGITDVSWNPSKEPDYTKQIVLINAKSSDERLNKQDEAYLAFLKQVNTFIVDECQHLQALTNFEPIFYMNELNLKHIIGYSGSPFRNYDHPYNNADDFTLIAIIGEPAFTYEMKDTIEDKNIAQPYSYFINYKNKEAWLPPQLKDNYFVQYRMNITHNKARNRAGIEMLKFLDKHNIKTLASINNIKPGQNLMKTLKEEGVNSIFVCGDNTIHEYKTTKTGKIKLSTKEGGVDDIKHVFEQDYNIIFGSTVMDEGVDIAEFQAVVLFSGGKTPIAGIQRVGRASRKKKTGKNISFVIDFKDVGGAAIFQNQYEKRKKMMKDCGVINIEKVQDFCKMIEDLNKE